LGSNLKGRKLKKTAAELSISCGWWDETYAGNIAN